MSFCTLQGRLSMAIGEPLFDSESGRGRFATSYVPYDWPERWLDFWILQYAIISRSAKTPAPGNRSEDTLTRGVGNLDSYDGLVFICIGLLLLVDRRASPMAGLRSASILKCGREENTNASKSAKRAARSAPPRLGFVQPPAWSGRGMARDISIPTPTPRATQPAC